jgi:hypothetical protein
VLRPPLSHSYQYYFDGGGRNFLNSETLWIEKYESGYGYGHFKMLSRDDSVIERL